jgi:hypothetical protein
VIFIGQEQLSSIPLIFRSERVDPQRPALREAMNAAYGAFTEAASATADASLSSPGVAEDTALLNRFVGITAAWAIAHGLALLLIDGRLRPMTDDAGADAFISAALSRLLL